jgi:hypothetical protein
MKMLMKCNLCGEFRCPYDNIGLALMQEHFRDKHPDHYTNVEGLMVRTGDRR